MAFIIPNLIEANCRILTICGQLKTENSSILEWCKSHDEWRECRIETAAGIMFARIGLGGNSGKHCHIDLASAQLFQDGRRQMPKTDLALEALQEIAAPLMGEEIDARLKCRFAVGYDRMPLMVKTMSRVSVKKGNIHIRMNGGSFSITGIPVNSISWEADDKNETVGVVLQGRKTLLMTDQYLSEAFGLLKSAYDTFVGGEVAYADNS